MKAIKVILLLLTILLAVPTQAAVGNNSTVQKQGSSFQVIFREMRQLAKDYNLSSAQKAQLRQVLLSASPEAMSMVKQLMDNRLNLLDLTRGQVAPDMQEVAKIASQQGLLMADLIIWKEQLKADMRAILDADQMEFVDAFIEQLIELRSLILSKL